MNWIIFGTAAVLYGLFWSWYVGFGRKITPPEIERVMNLMNGGEWTDEQRNTVRRFLEEDDGKDFVMVNGLHFKEPVAESRKLFAKYGAAFRNPLIKRAGHPLVFARAAAANIENVNCDAANHWSMAAVVRYRSRADFAEIASQFVGTQNHQWKLDALEKTFAFPASPWFVMGGPRIVVALVLALSAALVQIAVV